MSQEDVPANPAQEAEEEEELEEDDPDYQPGSQDESAEPAGNDVDFGSDYDEEDEPEEEAAVVQPAPRKAQGNKSFPRPDAWVPKKKRWSLFYKNYMFYAKTFTIDESVRAGALYFAIPEPFQNIVISYLDGKARSMDSMTCQDIDNALRAFPDPARLSQETVRHMLENTHCVPVKFADFVDAFSNTAQQALSYIPSIDAISLVYLCKKNFPARLKFDCAVDKDNQPWTNVQDLLVAAAARVQVILEQEGPGASFAGRTGVAPVATSIDGRTYKKRKLAISFKNDNRKPPGPPRAGDNRPRDPRRGGAAGSSGRLARPCRHCGGDHFDNMCPKHRKGETQLPAECPNLQQSTITCAAFAPAVNETAAAEQLSVPLGGEDQVMLYTLTDSFGKPFTYDPAVWY